MTNNPTITPTARPQVQPALAKPIHQAIAGAARRTSIDFDFLIAQAQVESSMNPGARARTSSASGLYQFIESTWLETMKRHGGRFGFDDVAAQISVSPAGSAYVANPADRKNILAMRFDPQVASLMAAGLAEDNREHLTPILGREPHHDELYLAHFLGAGGAGRFLTAMADNPNQSAAALFARPAAANRAVFYESNGAARSLVGVMDFLGGKLERALARAPDAMAYANGTGAPYLFTDTAVLGPMDPPQVTFTPQYRPPAITSAPRTSSAQLSIPAAGTRPPMSQVLQSTFGTASSSPTGGEQIKRAYAQLKALGL